MKRHARLLALIVNARDVVHQASARAAVAAALDADALDLLQLRTDARDDIDIDIDAASDVLHAICAPTRGANAPKVILNASLDVLARREDLLAITAAAAPGFDGWHVKERDLFHDDLPSLMERARAHTTSSSDDDSNKPILGCSVHSVTSAMHAARLGFDYIQVGTMFQTLSHPEKTSPDQLEGPALLEAIVSAAHSDNTLASLPPLIAVGGINTPQQIREVLCAGASGAAVIRGILAASDGARAAAIAYRRALDASISIN